jgi:hypothetical protein
LQKQHTYTNLNYITLATKKHRKANAFQLWLHYLFRNTMPRWQPRTTL